MALNYKLKLGSCSTDYATNCEKSIFGSISDRLKSGAKYVGKNVKHIHECNKDVYNVLKEGVKNTTSGVYHLAREAPGKLTDRSWWKTNSPVIKPILVSATVPIIFGVIIGATLTRWRVDFGNALGGNLKTLRNGQMPVWGEKTLNPGHPGFFDYIPPSNPFKEGDVVSLAPITNELKSAVESYDNGVGIKEHLYAWGLWGAGAAGGLLASKSKKICKSF